MMNEFVMLFACLNFFSGIFFFANFMNSNNLDFRKIRMASGMVWFSFLLFAVGFYI